MSRYRHILLLMLTAALPALAQTNVNAGRLQGVRVCRDIPTVGEVLKFDGSQWCSDADSGGAGGSAAPPFQGSFTAVSTVTYSGATHGMGTNPIPLGCWDNATPRNAIVMLANYPTVSTSTGDVVFSWTGTKTGICKIVSGSASGTAGGDLTGTYPTPSIAANAVTTSKILDAAVTMAKLPATIDFTTKAATSPVKLATTPPPACNVGELYFDTNDAAGLNLFGCTSSNVYTLLGDGGGSGGAPIGASYVTATSEGSLSAEVNLGALTSGILKHTVSGGISAPATATPGTDYSKPDTAETTTANRTYSGSTQDFSAASFLRLKTGSGAATGSDCDAVGEVGRVYLRSDPAAPFATLYVCANLGPGTYGWELYGGGGGGGGAPTDAHYFTDRAEAGLINEVNFGMLTTGILKHTVAGAVSTPATATPGTDYSKSDTAETVTANRTYSGATHDYSAASVLRLKTGTGAPISGDCDAAGEMGRVYLRSDPAATFSTLYVCANIGASTYGWELYSNAGGAGSLSALTDLRVTSTTTVVTLAAGAVVDDVAGVSTVFSDSPTITKTGGTDTGTFYVYVDNTSGTPVRKCNYGAGITIGNYTVALFSGSTCTSQSGFPAGPGIHPLATVGITSGSFSTTPTDFRALFSISRYTAGSGLSLAGNSFSVNTATIPTYGSSTTVPGSCTAYGQIYWDTDLGSGQKMHYCNGSTYEQITGGGGASDPFSLSGTAWLLEEPFCGNSNTAGAYGTHGWTWVSSASGGVSYADNSSFNGAPCGLRVFTDSSNGTTTGLHMRTANSGVASENMWDRAHIAAKAWRAMFMFYLPATITSTTYYIGPANDYSSQAATRSVFAVRFLDGTSTNWEMVTSSGGGSFTVQCTASAPPVASRFYILDLDNGSGGTTINAHLRVSATDYVTAQGTSDLFSSCSFTLPTSTEGFGPVFNIVNNSAAAREMHVHRFVGRIAW